MTDLAPLPSPTRKRRVRVRYIVVAVLCAGAVIWMLLLLQKNVVFFKPVAQAVHDQSSDGTRTMRIGGGVVPASIVHRDDGVDFKLTQGGATVSIHHIGGEPALFKDCAPVVAEGHWDAKGSTATFDSTRLLIKHDNNYEPPKTQGTSTVCPPDEAFQK